MFYVLMLFTSIKFFLFFIIVFVLYWNVFGKSSNLQNIVLLIASYVFYGIAEWKMIPLLLIATLVFYYLGIALYTIESERKKTFVFWTGILLGVGIIAYFKFSNFFIISFADFFSSLGLCTNLNTFKVIMPLGISYFTFKLISYLIEIYRGKMGPCTDIISFSVFVSFFPTIMAGPIDRPNVFLPQLKENRVFSQSMATDGMRQILWGAFKKIVIADNLAVGVNYAWSNVDTLSGSTLFISAMLYAIQMYCDFSGYSDMAIGIGKLLGIRIARNFNKPFFATNIAEFWRRWHMSLTSWVTDYVFTPLNIKFRDWGRFGIIIAIIINMVIVGIWHGDSINFALFGLYQGVLFVPLILNGKLNKKQKVKPNKIGLPTVSDFAKMINIFTLFAFSTIIFRATDFNALTSYLSNMVLKFVSFPHDLNQPYFIYFMVLIMFIVEWIQRDKENILDFSIKAKPYMRWSIYFVLFALVYYHTFSSNEQQFIYFQF